MKYLLVFVFIGMHPQKRFTEHYASKPKCMEQMMALQEDLKPGARIITPCVLVRRH